MLANKEGRIATLDKYRTEMRMLIPFLGVARLSDEEEQSIQKMIADVKHYRDMGNALRPDKPDPNPLQLSHDTV